MKRSEKYTSQFAICVNNSEYPASLELHKIYRVLRDEDAEQNGDVRVIDESGEDYLFPSTYFMMVELAIEVSPDESAARSNYLRSSMRRVKITFTTQIYLLRSVTKRES